MIVLQSQGRVVGVPGSQLMEPHTTRYPEAWTGVPITVQLYEPVAARRIAPTETKLLGEWFALDTDERTSNVEFAERSAIPGVGNVRFPKRVQGVIRLPAGTVLNVGIAAPLFGLPGGGIQVEWLDGPSIPTRVA
jgi:hypothetical protein